MVFASHSVASRELGIVYSIANEVAKRGAFPYIPDSICLALKESDYILAIATSSGFQLQWLNREVKEGLKERKS